MIPDIIASDAEWPYSKAKTAVLSAAAAVIREEGPRAATLKNIANRAGITEPAIFRHFDGVDGLFGGLFTVFERIWRRFTAAFEAGSDAKGLEHLREAVSAVAELLAGCGDYAYIVANAEHVFRGYPDLRAKVTALKKGTGAAALACVQEGQKSGDIRSDADPMSIVSSSIGMFTFTATSWIESDFSFDLRDVCEARWEDIERFVATRPIARSADRAPRLRSAALKVESAVTNKETARAPKGAKRAASRKDGAAKKATAAKQAAGAKARSSAKKK